MLCSLGSMHACQQRAGRKQHFSMHERPLQSSSTQSKVSKRVLCSHLGVAEQAQPVVPVTQCWHIDSSRALQTRAWCRPSQQLP